jgi:hypothetical protein
MKQNDTEDLPKLKQEVLENIFTVHKDKDGMYFYNLLQSIEFPKDIPSSFFEFYNIKYGDTWPLISFKVFQTPNLWWLILLANDIINPLEPVIPGTTIKIPNTFIVQEVLKQIIR